jgi:hypothetical protein
MRAGQASAGTCDSTASQNSGLDFPELPVQGRDGGLRKLCVLVCVPAYTTTPRMRTCEVG